MKKIFLGLVIVSVGAIGLRLLLFGESNGNTNKAESKTVKTVVLDAQEFNLVNEYSGFVQGDNQAKLSPKISARVLAIYKKEGEKVKKGEAVALLSADEITSQAKSAEKTVNELYKTLEATRKYYNQKIDETKDNEASDEEEKSAKRMRDLQVQSVMNEIVQAQGSLDLARSLSGETVVRAPFDGVVVRIFEEVGQLVGPGKFICEIADLSQLSLDIFVGEEVASRIRVGDEVQAFCGKDERSCRGSIVSIGAVSESGGQKAPVKIFFDRTDRMIQLGQYATVKLKNGGETGRLSMVIPEEAIISSYDEKFVFVVENGIAKERKVILGGGQDGKSEVVSGLSFGEEIIVRGAYEVINNDQIKKYE